MKAVLRLKAPAKINLYLKVSNRRKDGYHNLISLMQMVGLYDELCFEACEKKIHLDVQNSVLSAGDSNLVLRAAQVLRAAMLSEGYAPKGAAIFLKKEIPVAAGLAGGSSDAAATLIGLNRLWELDWSPKKLARLGEKLGSDLPFFFSGPTAWVSGRGEIVEPIDNAFKGWIVLVNPGFAVSTAAVFEAFYAQSGLTKKGAATNISRMQSRPLIAEVLKQPRNDLEAITLKRFTKLEAIKYRLKAVGGACVLMSGSGPSLFGFFENREKAETAVGQIRKMRETSSLRIWAVPLLQSSPFSQLFC